MSVSTSALLAFVLVLVRVSTLFLVAPVLSAMAVPVRVRAQLAFYVSCAGYVGAGFPVWTGDPSGQEGIAPLLRAALSEAAIGFCAGIAARFFIDAASAAGHVAGISMGIGYAALIDPLQGSPATALSELFSMVALGAAVALGVHREAVAWICHSFIQAPPGTTIEMNALVARCMEESIRSCVLVVRLAFPVLAACTVGHLLLALLSRMTPQLNLQSIGFSIAVLAGGYALYLTAPAVGELAARAALDSFAALSQAR